jgi:hypothetical protein
MSVVVDVKAAARTVASRVDSFTAGAADTIGVDLPVDMSSGFAVPAYQKPVAASKLWVATLGLLAATPRVLDLTALAGGQGDASFAQVTLFGVYNLEAPDSGRSCLIGNEGSPAEWYDVLGLVGSVLEVPAGRERVLDNGSATGWPVGARKLVRLDPGATPCTVVVVVAGN